MSKLNSLSVVLTIILSVLYSIGYCEQPSYQVSIYIRLHPKGQPIPYCSGSIIQSRLVLTSATCVYYQFVPNSAIVMVSSEMLSIVAGSADVIKDSITIGIKFIEVHNHFNASTMEHDIALLHLSDSLPLGIRNDMKWIILEDDETFVRPCLANFYVRNIGEKTKMFSQTEELEILETSECNNEIGITDFRKTDICSQYILPSDFECKDMQSFRSFNSDRGTALICNSKLVGVLSEILMPLNSKEEDCFKRPLKAFYTNIGPYLDWIYEIIAYEENIDIENNYFAASAPYQIETEAIIAPVLTMFSETSTTNKFNGTAPRFNGNMFWNTISKQNRCGSVYINNNFILFSILIVTLLFN